MNATVDHIQSLMDERIATNARIYELECEVAFLQMHLAKAMQNAGCKFCNPVQHSQD